MEYVTWSPLIDSLIPWKRVFLYDNGKSMWINDIVICSGCLVISCSFSQSVRTPVILCVFLSCVVCQVKIDSFVWVPFLIFPKRLTPDFESKLKNCLFDYILLNRVRKDDWRCLRLLKRPKRPSIKSSILGWPYSWIFQRVNPWFWVKMWKLFFWSYFFW